MDPCSLRNGASEIMDIRKQGGAWMFTRIVASVAKRVRPTSLTKRRLVSIAARHLSDVAYTRLRDRGFAPGSIIDVGACSGEWSRSVRKIFPSAPIFMIEARSSEGTNLENTCRAIGNADFAIGVLGATREASIPFYVLGTGSSIFPEQSNVGRELTTLPMTTLDDIMLNRQELRAPIFVKLDVQGAEIEVLEGAVKTLERSEIVQLETALLPYNEGAPSAAEVISFMDKMGFAIFDITGFIWQKGIHLIQIDVMFARKDSQLRPHFFYY